MKWMWIWITLALAVILWGACPVLSDWAMADYAEPEFLDSVVRSEGDLLLDQIEQFYKEHGHYPESLAKAGIQVPKQRFGGWKYERRSESTITLSIGKYSRNQFEMVWTTERGWELDR